MLFIVECGFYIVYHLSLICEMDGSINVRNKIKIKHPEMSTSLVMTPNPSKMFTHSNTKSDIAELHFTMQVQF